MSLDLNQAEAETLIAMPKRPSAENVLLFPLMGEKLIIELESLDKTEDFFVDVSRSRIDLAKITYQNRARQVVVLLRLDVNGAPHRNPDGVTVPCPHLHIYREGYGHKWASPVTMHEFPSIGDQQLTLVHFLRRCNVVELPSLQAGLF